MGVMQVGNTPVPTARPKNPGVMRMEFNVLVARVCALEAEVKALKERKPDDEESNPDKASLVAEALALGVLGADGKPAAPTTLERWAVKRLQDAIAAKKPEA